MSLNEEEAKKIAHAIAFGHAYEKHAANVSEAGELITQSSFESLILETLLNPAKVSEIEAGRSKYWNAEECFLVIVNPLDPDMGTAYWPIGGIDGYKVIC
jgi:hypothetical protein